MGVFATVFAWRVWEVGEPRKGLDGGGRGVKRRELVTCREDSKLERTFAYSEGFAVTERAGERIVHLSV